METVILNYEYLPEVFERRTPCRYTDIVLADSSINDLGVPDEMHACDLRGFRAIHAVYNPGSTRHRKDYLIMYTKSDTWLPTGKVYEIVRGNYEKWI